MTTRDMAKDDLLERYRQKRNFGATPEPDGGEQPGTPKSARPNAKTLRYVIQKHWASQLHYDFRLEFEGTLKSWAVPKGPSLDPKVKRMAVEVEDHPLACASFEGTIPPRQYGAGKVIVWDTGSWQPIEDAARGFASGKLKFELHGHKLRGNWALVRMRGKGEKQPPWLLIKEPDDEARTASGYDITEALPDSVANSVAGMGAHEKADSKPAEPDLPAAMIQPSDPASFPDMLEPQLATLTDAPPARGDWVYELKLDGYRLMTRIDGDNVSCITRNGHDWTAKLPQLDESLAAMGLQQIWLDGEIVVPDAGGLPDFQLLQNAFEGERMRRKANAGEISGPNAATIIYYVFDIPFYAGHDLRAAPLTQRRALLHDLMQRHDFDNLRFSEAVEGPANELLQSACKLGVEGLIGKRADAPYRPGCSTDWIKLKCGQRQEFVICGFTEPKGLRNGLGALVLGVHDQHGQLQYAGNVGTGFNEQELVDLRGKLDELATDQRPFDGKAAIPGQPHWVKPELLAEVSFAGWTESGYVRQAVFVGLRTDKAAHAITREKAVKPVDIDMPDRTAGQAADHKTQPGSDDALLPASFRVTHPERVIDQQTGITKLDLLRHYAVVAPLILPHLKGRPVSLTRAPSGVSGELFFQKHAKEVELPGIKLLDPALDPGHEALLEIHNATGLLSAAQMNTVEFHTWNALASSISKPDRMTFDLDPGDGFEWAQMQQAAELVKTMLEELELVPFLKTSGGKGLHIVVPLKKSLGWDAVKNFSHHIVKHLAKTLPQLFVAKSGPANRVGKVFADYLRNGFGATTVSAWSVRARPGMGVSVPVGWDELPTLTSGSHWALQTVADRLETGNTPWKSYTASARLLGPAIKVLGYKA